MKDKIKTLYRLDEQECKTLSMTYKKPQIYMNSVAAIALCRNGSIMVIHNPMNYDFSGWESVIKVSCGKAHLVGLRSDGTVLAAGDNSAGQCDVSAWRDVADIAAYDNMTVGLSTAGESFIAGRTFLTGTAAVCAVETADKKMQDTDIQTNVSENDTDDYEDISNICERIAGTVVDIAVMKNKLQESEQKNASGVGSDVCEDSSAGVKTPANTSIQENVSGTIRDSWEEIIANVNNGTYADKYKIGDTKALDLGSEGVVEMQIVAFNADELAECEGKAAITWISKQLLKTPYHMNQEYSEGSGRAAVHAAITWLSLQLLKTPCRMEPEDSEGSGGAGFHGGWEISEMRIYLKMKIRPLIPKNIRNAIKSVKKYSLYKNETGRFPSVEDVWIPSYREIFGGSSFERLGAEYSAFFCDDASRIKCNADGSAVWWWLRSARGTNTFNYVPTDGSYNSYTATKAGGVALGFCT